jgi:hypothetical protein
MDPEVASRAGIAFTARGNLRVAVANGDRVASFGYCRNLTISISGKPFVIDCYGLALGSYEMVLGVQWLASLGPILWDFGTQPMSFIRNRHTIKWSALASPGHVDLAVAFATADVLEELL